MHTVSHSVWLQEYLEQNTVESPDFIVFIPFYALRFESFSHFDNSGHTAFWILFGVLNSQLCLLQRHMKLLSSPGWCSAKPSAQPKPYQNF